MSSPARCSLMGVGGARAVTMQQMIVTWPGVLLSALSKTRTVLTGNHIFIFVLTDNFVRILYCLKLNLHIMFIFVPTNYFRFHLKLFCYSSPSTIY